MEIPKPAVSQLVGGDQICNDGEMALLVTTLLCQLHIARAIAFSLELNLDI